MSQTRGRELASHARRCHWQERIAVFVSKRPLRSAHAPSLVRTGTTVHGHGKMSFTIARSSRATSSARRSHTRVTHWVQRGLVISTPAAAILAVCLLAFHLKGSEMRGALRIIDLGAAAHGRRAVGSGKLICEHTLLLEVFVVVLAAHVCVLGNALFARFPADEGPAHGASEDAGCDDQNGSREHDPSTPFYVRHEEQDVDEECQKSDEKSWDGQDKEGEKEARRVSGCMEVGSNGKREADQDKQSRYRVHNQNGRQTGPGGGGQREVVGDIAGE